MNKNKKSRKKKRSKSANKPLTIEDVITNTLAENVEISKSGVEAVFKQWKERLNTYENNDLLKELTSCCKNANIAKELQNGILEILQQGFEEYTEHRSRVDQRTGELVNDLLHLFREGIDMACNRDGSEVKGADHLDQIGGRIKDDVEEWNMLKDNIDVLNMFYDKMSAKIEKKHNAIEFDKRKMIGDAISNVQWKNMVAANNKEKVLTRLMTGYDVKFRNLIKPFTELNKNDKKTLAKHIKLKKFNKTLTAKLEQLTKNAGEIESSTELKATKADIYELQPRLYILINKTKTNLKLCVELRLLHSRKTKKIFDKVNDLLKKGESIKKIIDSCQKIETSIKKHDLYPKADESPEIFCSSEIRKWPKLYDRVGRASLFLKRLDEKHAKLREQNNASEEELVQDINYTFILKEYIS